MPYIYSTLSNDQAYTTYKDTGGNKPSGIDQQKVIKGKANVVDAKHLITPRGVANTVTDAELKLLNECPMFKRHKDAGYITVDQKKTEGDNAAKNMTAKDKSAPLTEKEVDVKPNGKGK